MGYLLTFIGPYYRNYALNRGHYKLIAFALFLLAIYIFIQKYVQFHQSEDYSPLNSLAFNLLLAIVFLPFLPLIVTVSQKVQSFRMRWKFVMHPLILTAIVSLYMLASSIIVYVFGFISHPLLPQFYEKYILGVSVIHVAIYVFIMLFFETNTPHESTFIEVKEKNKKYKIDVSSIVLIKGMDHYVKIYTTGKIYIKKTSLNSLNNFLVTHGFVRIHKSYIVNKQKILAFSLNSNGGELQTEGNHSAKIGKTYVAELKSDPYFTNHTI